MSKEAQETATARNDTFKKGLGTGKDAVRRRAEENITLRKSKRKQKLDRQRGSIMTVQKSNEEFHAIVQEYKAEPKLPMLRTLLQTATEFQLAHYLFDMVQGQVVQTADGNGVFYRSDILCQLCQLMVSDDPQKAILAIDCLKHITAAHFEHTNDDEQYIRILLEDCRFLSVDGPCWAFLNVVATSMPQQQSHPVLLDVWDIIINMLFTRDNDDLRDIILQSAIFCEPGTREMQNAPFVRLLLRKGNSVDMNMRAVRLLAIAMDSGAKRAAPSFFVNGVWNFFMPLFQSICVNVTGISSQEYGTDPHLNQYFADLCTFLFNLGRKCAEPRAAIALTQLMLRPDTKEYRFIAFLVESLPRLNNGNYREQQTDIANFLVRLMQLGGFPETQEVHMEMERAGALDVMHGLLRAVGKTSDDMKNCAVRWIANYCYESLDHVGRVMETGILVTIIETLRMQGSRIKTSALWPVIYLILAVCDTCTLSFLNDMGNRNRASGYLGGIVNDLSVIRLTCMHLHEHTDTRSKGDILRLWSDLMRWEPQYVAAELEKYGGVDKVAKMWESQNQEVYQLAETLQQQLEEVMEVEGDDDDDVVMTTSSSSLTFNF